MGGTRRRRSTPGGHRRGACGRSSPGLGAVRRQLAGGRRWSCRYGHAGPGEGGHRLQVKRDALGLARKKQCSIPSRCLRSSHRRSRVGVGVRGDRDRRGAPHRRSAGARRGRTVIGMAGSRGDMAPGGHHLDDVDSLRDPLGDRAAASSSGVSAWPPRNQQCPPLRVIGGPAIKISGPACGLPPDRSRSIRRQVGPGLPGLGPW